MEHPSAPTLKRSLTLRHIVFFGLAFMAPQTFFSTYGVAVHSTSGMRNLFEVPVEEIPDTKAVLTIVDGIAVLEHTQALVES